MGWIARATALLLVASSASAQGFDVEPGWAIEAEDGTFTEGGVGAPSVVFEPRTGRWFMFFETQLVGSDPSCPQGLWAIGMAWSLDGRSWRVRDRPVVTPEPGTFYSCAAAHPTAVVEGDTLHLWFKAEQGIDACDDGAQPWGCTRQSGVGYQAMNSMALVGYPPVRRAEAPVLALQWFGFPSVVRQGDEWVMLVAKVPSIYVARSDRPDGGFVLDPKPVLTPGFDDWAGDRVFNPALLCTDDPASPLEAFPGGRTLEGGRMVRGGIGHAASSDGTSWSVADSPIFDWGPDDPWAHWDVVRLRTGEHLIWFSELGEDGRPRIGQGATTRDWRERDVMGRVCGAAPSDRGAGRANDHGAARGRR